MIEKLSEYKITSRDGSFINVECNTKIINTLVQKINELVDAVNWLGQSEPEPQPTNMYDLYVKNRHLIGKLCKFKCAGGYCYGLLTNIKRKPCQWPFEALGRAFSTCEPVSPDDDIIYKKEQQ